MFEVTLSTQESPPLRCYEHRTSETTPGLSNQRSINTVLNIERTKKVEELGEALKWRKTIALKDLSIYS